MNTKTLKPEAAHRDRFPGRHCAICGKVGGGGFRAALQSAGWSGTQAHPACIAREMKKAAERGH